MRRYLRCTTCPDWNPGRPRRSRLDVHRDWIDARLAEGDTNALELHRQLTAMGFRGSYGSVRRYVTKRLGAIGKKRERSNATILYNWRNRYSAFPDPEAVKFTAYSCPAEMTPTSEKRSLGALKNRFLECCVEAIKTHPGPVGLLTGLHRELNQNQSLPPLNSIAASS